jgi:hypothetical protein
VLLGLGIVLASAVQRWGNILYHLSLLAVLVLTLVLLSLPAARRTA